MPLTRSVRVLHFRAIGGQASLNQMAALQTAHGAHHQAPASQSTNPQQMPNSKLEPDYDGDTETETGRETRGTKQGDNGSRDGAGSQPQELQAPSAGPHGLDDVEGN